MFYYILFKRNVLLELIRYIKLGFILLLRMYLSCYYNILSNKINPRFNYNMKK